MSNAKRLRQLLASEQFLVAPGAYDGLTARLVEQHGFPLVYMTGAGTSAACGYPDYGLVTMTEMVDNAARMAASITSPLIADADTGYGNELNVTRTVRAFESRGVAGIHLEDQVSPKRCGHLSGKEVVPREAYLENIRAAVAARRDADFVLIARTDARAVLGLDEAIARVNAALALGADIAFVEAPQTLEEVAAIPRRVQGPCLLNVVPGGRTPMIDMASAAQLGYRLAIHPAILMYAMVAAADAALAHLRQHAVSPPPPEGMNVAGLFARCGAAEWDAVRERHAAAVHEQSA
ncbi:MAG: isocitrate lyase/PEP mutase family protein [Gammaproteobacteria bacterium]|nr:isocitrate lyase/PEP mutase family protein [Gammaproteobacteria bacterium]